MASPEDDPPPHIQMEVDKLAEFHHQQQIQQQLLQQQLQLQQHQHLQQQQQHELLNFANHASSN